LVLPFHLHRGAGGEVLDAVGVLLELGEEFDSDKLSLFMPVRAFSWGASFHRRIDSLREQRPLLAASLLIAHQDEIGTTSLAARLRRMVEANRAAARTARFAPNSMVLTRGASQSHETEDTDTSDTGPTSTAALSLMPLHGSPPSSRRPSGFPPSAPWLNGSEKLSSSVSSSREEQGAASRTDPYSVLPRSGVRSHGSQELSGPASARENFRRAAEVGAEARGVAGLDPEYQPKKAKDS
jgi:hypothetical protein